MSYYRRRTKYKASPHAVRHMSERAVLTRQFAGIDRDVERHFLALETAPLNRLLNAYGSKYGDKAEAYARDTYGKWRAGAVKISGQTAARLMELLPPVLPASVRFDLIKKLRSGYFKKQSIRVQSTPMTWKQDVLKPIQGLVSTSMTFALPETLVEQAKWLADGDAAAAHALLAAAEQEEAAIRLLYIEEEMRRIEVLLQDIDTSRRMSHTLKLPQGDITLTIELPPRTLMQRLTGWMR